MTPRLRIVTGKGGVGKSATAAALALALAKAGQRVLVCEVHGGDRIAKLLEVAPTQGRMREVRERVHLVDMNAEAAIHEYVLMTLRFERIYRAVFENRLVKSFLRLVPSLGEMVMLGKVWFHEREAVQGKPRFDCVILDAPATGHALSLLRTPQAVFAAVPAGPLREHAKNIRALLTDKRRTALHVVTTPEEMPVNEAQVLAKAAQELGIALGTTIINQRVSALHPQVLPQLAAAPELQEAAHALGRREAKRQEGESHLRRLPETLAVQVSLPRLPAEGFGVLEVQTLAALLGEALS